MSLLRHIAIAVVYGVLAILAALLLPVAVPEMGRWVGAAFGAVILIFGAVLHEVYARQARERALLREVMDLANLRDSVLDELSRARAEMRTLQARIEGEGDATLDHVANQVEVLQAVVADLTGGAMPGAKGVRSRTVYVEDGLPDEAYLQMIRGALREERVIVAVQPVVSLPQRKLRFYEAFSRIRNADGSVVQRHQFQSAAERADLMGTIDNVMLWRCAQLGREALRRNIRLGFFANVSLTTLSDARVMDEFIDYMALNRELAQRMILEFAMDDVSSLIEHHQRRMEELIEIGFRFSVDNARNLADLDVAKLGAHQFRFVKIDADTLLLEAQKGHIPWDMRNLKREFDRNAIDLVATRVEDEDMLIQLLDMPVDFGQGLLFGEPRTD